MIFSRLLWRPPVSCSGFAGSLDSLVFAESQIPTWKGMPRQKGIRVASATGRRRELELATSVFCKYPPKAGLRCCQEAKSFSICTRAALEWRMVSNSTVASRPATPSLSVSMTMRTARVHLFTLRWQQLGKTLASAAFVPVCRETGGLLLRDASQHTRSLAPGQKVRA